MSITQQILISGKRGHRTCVYTLWVIVFHPWAEKKMHLRFFVSTFDFSWGGNQWCFCKQQEDKTTTKSHPFVLTRVSTTGSVAACVMGGIKEEEREGKKKTPNKKEKGWRRKKDMKLQGRETGPRWCVWLEQSGSDSSSGHFRGFHPKIFLVLFAILQELETCTSSTSFIL